MNHFENSVIKEGKELFKAIRAEKESLFDKKYWLGRMMEWVMKDPSFKVDLFRFVDVLPVLQDKDQVAKHIEEYLLKKDRELPLLMGTALKAASFSFARSMAASAIRKNVGEMAERFILGNDLKSAKNSLLNLEKQGFCFTIDLLGEKTLSEEEADDYFNRYKTLILELPGMLRKDQNNPPNISIKISALTPNLKEEDPSYSVAEAKKRVLPLLRLAKEHGVFINFDVESFQSHEIISLLFKDIVLSDEFNRWPHIGIVCQAYLRESPKHLADLINWAKERGAPFSIRLVKGAYWDYEVIKAEQFGHDCPVFQDKSLTDLNFEKLSLVLLDAAQFVRPCFASHNIRSLAHALSYAKEKNIDPSRYEVQMLYGMAEAERKVILKKGHMLRIYVPIGDMLPGMSYLVRRLLENTSQMSFVKKSHHDQESEDRLLSKPLANAVLTHQPHTDFINEHLADFTKTEVRNNFNKALQNIRALFPIKIPIIINNSEEKSDESEPRSCPSDTKFLVSHLSIATKEHAEKAIKTAKEYKDNLNSIGLEERARQLLKLADILAEDRFLLSALICYEVGKTWAECDADVAEAIDFCRYYAASARTELQSSAVGQVSGEHNRLMYQPRGTTAIIAPWNFPLAILCGMSVAAYVAGNPIIIKPSEQSSLTAYFLFQRMLKAGFLPECVHFLPGRGEIIGAYLVAHPDTALICFTGSKAVGHEISKVAGTVVPGQSQMKKIIVEMGGKNAVIIDDDADLDEAVSAVIKSAFSYAGQKCSAASRIIPIGSITENFIHRLIEASKSLLLGPSFLASTTVGPVIDREAKERLDSQINRLKGDCEVELLYSGETIENGFFVPPSIFMVKSEQHWLMHEELFGPIIAVYPALNLEHALRIANNCAYALTGAFFSRSPANIEKAKAMFNVGNLYINQKCTGAMVHRQPFGGFKMSGTGIKAGGPHYLLNFVDARVISENTMRRGFAPSSVGE